MKVNWSLGLPIVLMLAFAVTRWPGMLPDNFSAACALAFCAGIYFPKKLAWWLPVTVLLASDLALNFFYYRRTSGAATLSVFSMMLYLLPNYAAYGALIWMGKRFSPRASWLALLAGGLLGAVLFYLVSNTGSWLQNPGYPKTLAGWIQALTTGIPGWPPTWTFFRNTLLSGGLFTGLFVGAMKWAEASETAEEEEEPAPESEQPEPEESKA